MAKKKLTLGMAAAAAAGTAVYVAKKSQDKKNQNGTSQNDIRDKANSGWSLTQHKINSSWTFNKKDDKNSAVNNSYRNTERGKYEKNTRAFIIPMVIMKLLQTGKAGGCGGKACLYRRQWSCFSGSGMFPCS